MSANTRRVGAAAGAVLLVCVVGEIIAARLITDKHVSCGSDIDRLVQLICHNVSYPHRGLGVVLAIVFALLAVATVVVWTALTRRTRARFTG